MEKLIASKLCECGMEQPEAKLDNNFSSLLPISMPINEMFVPLPSSSLVLTVIVYIPLPL